jgi:NADH-quinone oxidoreductase subunit H
LVSFAVFGAKTLFFISVIIWIRWSLPRFRYDQLMSLGWKVLLPGSLAYLMVLATAIWILESVAVEPGLLYSLVLFAVNLPFVYVVFWVLDSGRLVMGTPRRRRGTG